MATIIGIDLGTSAVKATVLEGRLSRPTVKDTVSRPVPHDGTGQVTLEARLAAAVALIGDLDDFGTTTLTVGYPAEAASLHAVTLPFSDRDKIDQTLPFELEGQVPFDLDDFILEHRVLHKSRVKPGASRVLCVLARRDLVRRLVTTFAKVDAEPRHVALDLDVLASFGGGAGARLVVDFGHGRTLVALVADNELLGGRAISLGGRDLTLALSRTFGWSWDEAQAVKHQEGLQPGRRLPVRGPVVAVEAVLEDAPEDGGPDGTAHEITEDLSEPTAPGRGRSGGTPNLADMPGPPSREASAAEVLEEALAPLLAQLRATAIALENQHGVEIAEVVVTGGGWNLQGLAGRLDETLGLPVRRAAWAQSDASEAVTPAFALSRALAARAAGLTGPRPLELRQGDLAFQGDMALVRAAMGYAALALFFFAVAGTGLFLWRTIELRGKVAEVEDQIAALVLASFPEADPTVARDPAMARVLVVEQAATVADNVKTLESAVAGEPPVLTLLKDLSAAMPPADQVRIELSDLTISESAVKLKADIGDLEQAAAVESALRKVEAFKGAQKGDEQNVRGEWTFTVTIPRETPAQEEG